MTTAVRILLLPVYIATVPLLFAAAALSGFASLLQWSATTLAQNAAWAMTVGDPVMRRRLLQRPP